MFSGSWIDALGDFRRRQPVLMKVFALEITDMLAKGMCVRAVKWTGLGFSQDMARIRNVTDTESDAVRNCRWFCLVLVESCFSKRPKLHISAFNFSSRITISLKLCTCHLSYWFSFTHRWSFLHSGLLLLTTNDLVFHVASASHPRI